MPLYSPFFQSVHNHQSTVHNIIYAVEKESLRKVIRQKATEEVMRHEVRNGETFMNSNLVQEEITTRSSPS